MIYIALLRGINVGGNNIIKMADLRECLESADYENVSTYIQSGNVLFSHKKVANHKLEEKLEKLLKKKFSYDGKVVVVSASELAKVVKEAPKGFGNKPDKYRYDVIFLKEPLTPTETVKEIPVNEEVDEISKGKQAVYFSRLIAKATKSKLAKIVSLPVYKQVTIRNWNTTTKLLEMSQDLK